MYCRYCKANNPKGSVYCFSCGAKLPVSRTASSSSSVAEEYAADEYGNAINWKRVGYWASAIIVGSLAAWIVFSIAAHFILQ